MKSKELYQMIAQLDTLQNPSGRDGHPQLYQRTRQVLRAHQERPIYEFSW